MATCVSAVEGKFGQCRTIANGQHAAGTTHMRYTVQCPSMCRLGGIDLMISESGTRITEPGFRAQHERIMWVRIQL